MPDVRMPDGTIIRNVPEGTTRAQLMARFSKSQAKPRTGGSGIGWLDRPISNFNELVVGGLEGLGNIADFVKQPFDAAVNKGTHVVESALWGRPQADANLARSRQQQQAQRGGFKQAVDWADRTFVARPNPTARTMGQIGASFAVPGPAGKSEGAGIIARGIGRAAQGALQGSAVHKAGESGAQSAGIGAAANVALPPALRWLGNTRLGQAAGKAVSTAARPVVNFLDDVAEVAAPGMRQRLGLPQLGNMPTPFLPPPAAPP